MESLVSFDKLGDVANNLLDKLSDAAGWIANHDTPKRIAVNTYIEEIKQGDYAPLTKAALISQAKKTIKEYCNQNKIVNIALQSMKPTSKPENVEDDWLVQFMDKARLVSDEEFQWIWGKILAEECNLPQSIPKVLLHILEQMDREAAKAFLAVCSISVYIEEETQREYHPIVILEEEKRYYGSVDVTFDTLIDLKALGLIEMDFVGEESRYVVIPTKTPVTIHYFEKKCRLREDVNEFSVGNVLFTKAGNALCRAVTVDKQEGFFEEYCLPMWKKLIEYVEQ